MLGMRGSGGGGGSLEFAKLNIADITANEKNSYHFHSYTSRLDPPPWKNFLDPRLLVYPRTHCTVELYIVRLVTQTTNHFSSLHSCTLRSSPVNEIFCEWNKTLFEWEALWMLLRCISMTQDLYYWCLSKAALTVMLVECPRGHLHPLII